MRIIGIKKGGGAQSSERQREKQENRVLTPDTLAPQSYTVVQRLSFSFHRISLYCYSRKASASNRSYFKSEIHTQTHIGITVCTFMPVEVSILLHSRHYTLII